MRRRAKITAAVAAGLFVLSFAVSCGPVEGWGPRPVVVAGPPDPLPVLPTGSGGPVCLGVDGWDGTPAPALFWVDVDPDPRSVTAVWWPTMNDHDCRVVATTGAQAQAGVLAAAIRAAPAVPSGRFNCPMDVGGAVDLYFAYQGGRWERVRVHPTGCARLTARGRKPRQSTLRPDLAALAPPGEWSRLLH